jgi:hypothetical protein
MLIRPLISALLLSGLTAFPAAAADAVTACDLAQRPAAYIGRMVQVRSVVDIGFEHFGFSPTDCFKAQIQHIWLEYGRGPKRRPTTWCCGDMVPRDPLPVKQDAAFKNFHRLLTATRKDKGCYEHDCYRYRVTATLHGRFDAAKSEPCPSGQGLCCPAAFGHIGLQCARLVIQAVSDIEAQSAPPR